MKQKKWKKKLINNNISVCYSSTHVINKSVLQQIKKQQAEIEKEKQEAEKQKR